jgi:hypothetical protein
MSTNPTRPPHSIAFRDNIHNHSDAYYQRMVSKEPAKAKDVAALKVKQRAEYQTYLKSADYQTDLKNGFQTPKTNLSSNPQGEASGSPATGSGVANSSGVATTGGDSFGSTAPTGAGSTTGSGAVSKTSTKDGYTVTDVLADMAKLAKADGTALPPAAQMQQIAQGIIDGVNTNFSGVNGIGNYANVSGKTMARTLTASAYQESKFNTQGQDAGGFFQSYVTRVQDYNAKFGTNYSQADLAKDIPLAAKVSTWAMANPTTKPGWSMVGTQAGNVPIPSDLPSKALYYWNYNPVAGHGHANELVDYMKETAQHIQNMG